MRTLLALSLATLLYTGCNVTTENGGEGSDYGYSITRGVDQGYVIAGQSDSYDDNFAQYFIKVFESEKKDWETTYNPEDTSKLNKIITTYDNSYVAVGKTAYLNDDENAIVTKIDNSGNVEWSRGLYPGVASEALSVIEDQNGNYIVTGKSVQNSRGELDIFVAKLTRSGELVWIEEFDRGADEWANDIVEAIDGTFVVAGALDDGAQDIYVLRVDSEGYKVSDTIIDQGYDDEIYALISDGSGFVMAGYSKSNRYSNGYVVALDNNFDKIWENTYSDDDIDFTSLVKAPDYGYLVVGNIYQGDNDVLAVQLDVNGDERWSRTYGGTGDDSASQVVVANDANGYMIAGTSNSYTESPNAIYTLAIDLDGYAK